MVNVNRYIDQRHGMDLGPIRTKAQSQHNLGWNELSGSPASSIR